MKIIMILVLSFLVLSLLLTGCSTNAQVTGDATSDSGNIYPSAAKKVNTGYKPSGTGHESYCY